MNAIHKMQLWLWSIFSVLLSVCISFGCWGIMTFSYSEMHNTSTAGDHEMTERIIIINDIVFASAKAGVFLGIAALCSFLFNEDVCSSLYKRGRKFNNLSLLGLRLSVLNLLILCLGPTFAGVSYYFERAPYFPK